MRRHRLPRAEAAPRRRHVRLARIGEDRILACERRALVRAVRARAGGARAGLVAREDVAPPRAAATVVANDANAYLVRRALNPEGYDGLVRPQGGQVVDKEHGPLDEARDVEARDVARVLRAEAARRAAERLSISPPLI